MLRSSGGERDHGVLTPSIAARAQAHDAAAARGERGIVRHQHQRRAALFVAGEQQVDDLPAGVLVEIAGRLVGDENRGIGRQRAGERDALLLAAGKLRRIMVRAARQVRPRRARRARAPCASATPASSSGTATFSSAVMVGIRWNDWKTMPTLRPRKRASASSSSLVEHLAGDQSTVPESGALQPGHDHQQRRFARAGRPDQADRLARCLYAGSTSLRICTRAAPCPSDRLTPASAIAGPLRVSHAICPFPTFAHMGPGPVGSSASRRWPSRWRV